MKKLVPLMLLILISSTALCQNAKQFAKAGKEFVEAKNYKDALPQYSKAISLNPKEADYYLERSKIYEKLGMLDSAFIDLTRAIVFDDDVDTRVEAGRLAFLQKNYDEAIKQLDLALSRKRTCNEAYEYKVKTLIAQQNFMKAQEVCQAALLNKETAMNFYLSAIILDNLSNFESAEWSYKKAISKDKKLEDAYVGLANLLVKLDKLDDAMEQCQALLKLNPNNTDAYIARSRVYVKRQDFPNAINDISKAIISKPNDEDLFYIRGQYYQQFTQHQNAINDFNKVLLINDKNAETYYQRAWSYEQIANYKAAIKDYEKLASLSEYDVKARKLLDSAKKRLFELNRESNAPIVKLFDPTPVDKTAINLAKDKKEVVLKGHVSEESELEQLQINGKNVPFIKNDDGFDFIASVNIDNIDMINISAGDVYKNISDIKFTINRTEITPPTVTISAPYASDNGEIYLDNTNSTIYVEGKAADESPIKSILIDGVSASYKLDEPNPVFSANLDVTNKNKITIVITDIYGNTATKEFPLNREGAAANAENPMGKTWVIFIENSNYQTFASLEGPVKDVSLMKSALAKYKISNVIHKKDMTKKDLERFFNIELRDLLRSNRVDALLLWYAGHGKFINNSGYWIPIDANREDEFTYFNISGLKAAMQSYASVKHLLVVTDACESGPTFYQAMRGTLKERDCGDWNATKFKSSQVFTSAGYELAVDNSQFTRTFANALANNPNACIPIENIVQKVTVAVGQNTKQKPQFGKIAGLDDEDGTFFFISK